MTAASFIRTAPLAGSRATPSAAPRAPRAPPLQANARAVPHAGWNLHGVALRPHLAAGAVAPVARLLDHRAGAAAARTRFGQREQALALRDDTAAVAHGTDHG